MVQHFKVRSGQDPELGKSKELGIVQKLKQRFEIENEEGERGRLQAGSKASGSRTDDDRVQINVNQGRNVFGLGKWRIKGGKSLGREEPTDGRTMKTICHEKQDLLGYKELGFLGTNLGRTKILIANENPNIN